MFQALEEQERNQAGGMRGEWRCDCSVVDKARLTYVAILSSARRDWVCGVSRTFTQPGALTPQHAPQLRYVGALRAAFGSMKH